MKNPRRNAERWIKEAEYTLQQAEQNCEVGAYNLVCFLAEQTAQKALKAVLYFGGARFVNIHSIAELLKEVSKRYPAMSELFEMGVTLDQYYLSSRYPDAVPDPAVPAEIFTKTQAEEAVGIAKKIFEACRGLVG